MSIAEVSKESDLIDFLVNKGNGVKGLSQMDLKIVPQKFIQPLPERLDFTQIQPSESIPIIDFSNFDDPKVAESICDAAEKWGFFQIVNHGIPVEVLENVIEAGHKFFELPVEERRKYLKENSPTHTVQLKTSFSPLAEKVLEWKDYLFHIYDDSDDDKSTQLWPAVSK